MHNLSDSRLFSRDVPLELDNLCVDESMDEVLPRYKFHIFFQTKLTFHEPFPKTSRPDKQQLPNKYFSKLDQNTSEINSYIKTNTHKNINNYFHQCLKNVQLSFSWGFCAFFIILEVWLLKRNQLFTTQNCILQFFKKCL